MSGVLDDEARPARVECPGSGCGQVDTRLQRAEMLRLATVNVADGDGEVRRSPAPPAGGGRLDQICAG